MQEADEIIEREVVPMTTNGPILGLDWDDTVTEYPEAFRTLCQGFRGVVIVTLNGGLTVEEAERRLGCKVEQIACCPDEIVIAGQSAAWKAQTCRRLGVQVMFDDDPDVVTECRKAGVPAVGVMPLPPA